MNRKSIRECIAAFFGKMGPSAEKGSLLSQQIFSKGYRSQQARGGLRKKGSVARYLSRFWESRQATTSTPSRKEEATNWKRIRIAAGVLVLMVVSYGLLQGPFRTVLNGAQTFRIHEVKISGCVMSSANELRKFADISYELNMLTLNPRQIKRRLLEHPWVAGAELRRIWPDRLSVTITEYRPVAIVADGEGDGAGLSYMDRKGTVFAKVSPGQELDYPVITGLDSFAAGLDKKEALAEATLFLRLASYNNPNLPAQNVSEIHINQDGGMTLYLVEQPFPILFGKGDTRKKFKQLREVLGDLYRKKKGGAVIENVAYIRMDYLEDKVLVAKKNAGKRHG